MVDGKQIKPASLVANQLAAGVIGVTGMQGITGRDGIIGSQGPTGVQGLTGVWGITGQWGITGVWGITGAWGITGVWGLTGRQGLTGIQGITGQWSITGVWGITGALGLAGSTGVDGPSSSVEVIVWRQIYQTGISGQPPIAIASGVDGLRIMPRFGTIQDIFMSVQQNGITNTTIGNILIGTGNHSPGVNTPWIYGNLASVFAAANRPMLAPAGSAAASTNAAVKAGAVQAPWSTGFGKGDIFAANVDGAGAGGAGLVIKMIVQYTGS